MEINVSKNTDETEHRHTRTSQTRTRRARDSRLPPGPGAAGLAASCWTREFCSHSTSATLRSPARHHPRHALSSSRCLPPPPSVYGTEREPAKPNVLSALPSFPGEFRKPPGEGESCALSCTPAPPSGENELSSALPRHGKPLTHTRLRGTPGSAMHEAALGTFLPPGGPPAVPHLCPPAPGRFPSQRHLDLVTHTGRTTRRLSSTAGTAVGGWGSLPHSVSSPERAPGPPRRRAGPLCQVLWPRGRSVQHRRRARVSGWGQG